MTKQQEINSICEVLMNMGLSWNKAYAKAVRVYNKRMKVSK